MVSSQNNSFLTQVKLKSNTEKVKFGKQRFSAFCTEIVHKGESPYLKVHSQPNWHELPNKVSIKMRRSNDNLV